MLSQRAWHWRCPLSLSLLASQPAIRRECSSSTYTATVSPLAAGAVTGGTVYSCLFSRRGHEHGGVFDGGAARSRRKRDASAPGRWLLWSVVHIRGRVPHDPACAGCRCLLTERSSPAAFFFFSSSLRLRWCGSLRCRFSSPWRRDHARRRGARGRFPAPRARGRAYPVTERWKCAAGGAPLLCGDLSQFGGTGGEPQAALPGLLRAERARHGKDGRRV